MTEITVSTFQGELRADSRTFAPKMDIRHRQLIENIRKYRVRFERMGVLPFQTEKPSAEGGRPQEYVLLNEAQAVFLLTLSRNTDAVVDAKEALSIAFVQARTNAVVSDIARLEGKKARHEETAAIAELVKYATDQGSKSAKMYYMSITKMTNEILGIQAGQRDTLPPVALDRIRAAEVLIDVSLRDGMRAGLHYKQIYALAKDRVQHLVPLLPAAVVAKLEGSAK